MLTTMELFQIAVNPTHLLGYMMDLVFCIGQAQYNPAVESTCNSQLMTWQEPFDDFTLNVDNFANQSVIVDRTGPSYCLSAFNMS